MRQDCEPYVLWAAEEFLAAGRADRPDAREAHRRRALFLADVCEVLNQGSIAAPPEPPIKAMLARAYSD
jgi:hypothetical protein